MRTTLKYRLVSVLIVASGTIFSAQASVAQDAAGDPGARLPWDYPLPPLAYMLHPDGRPPNGKPPETSTGPSPSMEVAQEAASAALAACRKDGLDVGVVVLDATGDLRVALSAPKMPPGRVYIAIRKGLSAIEFGVPTSHIPAILDADPSQMKRVKPYMATFSGGIPLIKDGKIIGAIAASGAKAVQDEACASAGASSVASRL